MGPPDSSQLIQSQVQVRPGPWLRLPLIDVASGGLSAVKRAFDLGSSDYSLPDSGTRLYFSHVHGDFRIELQVNSRVAVVQYSDLLAELERFAAAVKRLILRELPQMRSRLEWSVWFPRGKAG